VTHSKYKFAHLTAYSITIQKSAKHATISSHWRRCHEIGKRVVLTFWNHKKEKILGKYYKSIVGFW
jgi:hypothetical protein